MTGRKRDLKKESFWRRVVGRQAGSGLGVGAWCRRHQVDKVAFFWWRRELARRDAETASASFVPVRVTEDDAAVGGSQIEIVLADGRRIGLRGRVDRQSLRDVLAVLASVAPVFGCEASVARLGRQARREGEVC